MRAAGVLSSASHRNRRWFSLGRGLQQRLNEYERRAHYSMSHRRKPHQRRQKGDRNFPYKLALLGLSKRARRLYRLIRGIDRVDLGDGRMVRIGWNPETGRSFAALDTLRRFLPGRFGMGVRQEHRAGGP